jgi:hypothetical protein
MKKQLQKVFMLLVFLSLCWGNSAIGQTLVSATASSGTASLAIDGNNATRWESASSDPQWIVIELDKEYTLSRIVIDWEGANAKDYTIDISNDGTSWTTISTQTNMPNMARTDDLTISGDASYVRVYGTARNLTYGYSIWELELYGSPVGQVSTLTSIGLTADKTRLPINSDATITAIGYDQDGYAMATSPTWSTSGGTVASGVFAATTAGVYTITATDGAISNTIDITVTEPELTFTSASASDGAAAGAIDKNYGSMWVGDGNSHQWIYGDLGSLTYVTDLSVYWEGACATKYGVDISADGSIWQNIDSLLNGAPEGRTDNFITNASARYIRIHSIVPRDSAWGYKIWEMVAYGAVNGAITVNSINISSDATSVPANADLQLSLEGFDGSSNPYAVDPTWNVSPTTGSVDADGNFSATAAGTYTVSVSEGGVTSNSLSITATSAQVLGSVVVSPSTANVIIGNDYQFSAQAYDEDGLTMPTSVTWSVNGGGTIDTDGLFSATTLGDYTVTASQSGIDGTATATVKPENVAVGKTALASSAIQTAAWAIDGLAGTRWESAIGDPQWIYIDLGATYTLSDFILNWEGANAEDYTLSISGDASNWQTIYTATGMAAGARIDYITEAASARYVRMHGTARTIPYGYSLYEFETLGVANTSSLASLTVGADATTINITESVPLYSNGFDASADPYATAPTWTVNSTDAIVSTDGIFTSDIEGTYTVTATDGAVSNTIDIQVKGPELTTITISPDPANVDAGTTQQFTATGYDQFSNEIAATFSYAVDGGGTVNSSGLFSATTIGDYILTVNEGAISVTANITVLPGNIAVGNTVTASPAAVQSAANAVDGDANTAWECAAADSQYIYVDLAAVKLLSKVKLNWGAESAKSYTLAISADGTSWHTLHQEANNAVGASISIIPFEACAQYVRLLVRAKNGTIGILLNEFEIYGQDLPAGKVLTTLNVVSPKTVVQVAKDLQIEAHGFDQDDVPFATAPTWSVDPVEATISVSGIFNASAVNVYTVTANDGGIQNTINITSETNARLNRVDVTPKNNSVNIGQTIDYSVQGYDQFEEEYVAGYDWSTSGGGSIDANGLFSASSLGTHFITATSTSVSPTTGNLSGLTEIYVIQENLALSGTASASSEITAASNAIDNDIISYWESNATDDENITVNLGTMLYLSQANLNWLSGALDYDIEISADGLNWVTISEQIGKVDELRLDEINLVATAKHVRVTGISRNGTAGYKLNEFQVLGETIPAGKALATIVLQAEATTLFVGDETQITVSGTDGDAEAFAVAPTYTSTGGTVSTNGVFTSTTAGTFTITATDGTISNTIEITVQALPALTTINLTPTVASIQVTDTINFVAKGLDQYSDSIGITPAYSTTGGGTINNDGQFVATSEGVFTITVESNGISTQSTVTIVPENLVLNKAITASSEVQPASNAVDGNSASRWESAQTDPQWIVMDMGAMHKVTDVIINWEAANAENYTLDISADNSNWQTIVKQQNMTEGARIDSIDQVASAQYLRVLGTERTIPYGYSIFEVTVRGEDLPGTVALNSMEVLFNNEIAKVNAPIQFIANGFDADDNPFAFAPIWTVNNSDASISTTGMFTATAEGTFTVTATQGAINKTVDIEVRAASVISTITIDPQDQAIRVGDSIQYSAIAVDQYDDTVSVDLTWTSNGGGIIDTLGMFRANEIGNFTISASTSDVAGSSNVKVSRASLAKNKSITASSEVTEASLAVDGNLTTRWESEASELQWIVIDLGAISYIDSVSINWEGASAKNYSVQISNDNSYWQSAYEAIDKEVGPRVDNIVKNMTTQYLKISCTERNTNFGYSIYETDVYGGNALDSLHVASIAVSAARDTVPVTYELQLNIAGFDQNSNPFAVTPVWSVDKTTGSVSSEGLFSGTEIGDYVITATVGTTTNTFNVYVAEPSVLQTLEITSAIASLRVARTAQFEVVGIDQYDLEMKTNVAWATTGGGTIDSTGLFLATTEGSYIISATQDTISATAAVNVLPENLAYGKTTIASSAVQSAIFANDDDVTTRWESSVGEAQWLTIDFNDTSLIKSLILNWETANAKVYSIDISADNLNWQTIATQVNMAAGVRIDTIPMYSSARYFRVNGLERNTEFGYSLFEVEAYGDKHSSAVLNSVLISSPKMEIVAKSSLQLSANGFDVNSNPIAFAPIWGVIGADSLINTSGLFTPVKEGDYLITAFNGTLADTLTISVVAAPVLKSITVTPVEQTVNIGSAIQFAAQSFDTNGDTLNVDYAWTVTGGGEITQTGLFAADSIGEFTVQAKADTIVGTTVFTVIPENVALNRPIGATSEVQPASNANDGDAATFWESEDTSPQSIVVDFEEMFNFSAVNLLWTGIPSAYEIAISADSIYWQTISSIITKGTKSGYNSSARFVKVTMLDKSFEGGYKLNTFEILGEKVSSAAVLDSIAILADTNVISTAETLQFVVEGFDAFKMPFAFTPAWSVTNGGSITETGAFSASLPGTYLVKASSGSIEDSISIIVNGSVLTSIKVSPPDTSITLGSNIQYNAQAYDQSNVAIEADILWSIDGGGTIDTTGLFIPTELGTFIITAASSSVSPTTVDIFGTASVTVFKENLALNKTIEASSEEWPAMNANDGDTTTYWESTSDANQWISIDFAKTYTFNNFMLYWEANSASSYAIAISADEQNWQTILSNSDMTEGKRIDTLNTIVSAQFIRVKGLDKVANAGYQIAEIEAYGQDVSDDKVLSTLTVVADETTINSGSSLQLEAHGFDQDEMPFAAIPVWNVDNDGLISGDGKFTATTAGTYTVTASSNGITGTFSIVVEGTDVNQLLDGVVCVYSSNKVIYINNIDLNEFSNVKVYNSNGSLIKVIDTNSETLEISTAEMQPGIYIVSLCGNSIVNNSVVVE